MFITNQLKVWENEYKQRNVQIAEVGGDPVRLESAIAKLDPIEVDNESQVLSVVMYVYES